MSFQARQKAIQDKVTALLEARLEFKTREDEHAAAASTEIDARNRSNKAKRALNKAREDLDKLLKEPP